LEYGKELREQFYQSIFGQDGLALNMARYNVGGGNASDVAYGYPFMREGAAVPGYWKDDPTGSDGTYGGTASVQSNKDAIAEAFNPNDESQYDWSKGSAQEWWLKRGAQGTDGKADIDTVEAFSNSAPWFLTNSGYATGGFNSGSNNLQNPEKFAQYLAAAAKHLEALTADNGNKVSVDTVEPFNESETNYWGTSSEMASQYADGSDGNAALIKRYAKEYQGKDYSVTPYSNALKKPQEGMHVGNAEQQTTLKALSAALDGTDMQVVATDATNASDFMRSYNAYPQEVRDLAKQYNVHAYSEGSQRQARDVAQGDSKQLSMSEVDGSWQSGSFNPYGFDNALGMAGKISSNVWNLQSKDFTFWQVVEDLYNMQEGNDVNPAGENTNWGTVLIDFDCTVAAKDPETGKGALYSKRRVDNNGGKTDGLQPCSVLVNSKYNGVRAITQFIRQGDSIIANNDTGNTMTAQSADGKTQTIIRRNSGTSAQKLVIDLSKYGEIADDAAGTLYLTTESSAEDVDKGENAATPDVFKKTSNMKQGVDSVSIDVAGKTATVTIPARSIASVQLTGVTGVAETASIEDGQSYQLVGQQSGRSAQVATDGALTIEDTATDAKTGASQSFVLNQVAADSKRPTLRKYVVSSADGNKVLDADGRFVAGAVESAENDQSKMWILNTEDGTYFSLVNASVKKSLEVGGQKTAAGSAVGVYESNGGAHQAWLLRSTAPTGVQTVNAQASVGGAITMPQTVTPYYTWGTGSPVQATWDTSKVDTAKEGTYTATGTATDIFGNVFTFEGTVVVGQFTVADPASVTMPVGTSFADAQAAVASTAVYAHVGASDAIAVDPSAVTWDYSGVEAKLASAQAGDRITFDGSIATGEGASVTVRFTLYLVSAQLENIADSNTNLTVTDQQTEYSKGDQWKRLTDGNTTDEAWVTWNSKGDYSHKPTATLDFGRQRRISSVTITYGDQTPASAKAEYSDDGVTWKQFGVEATAPSAGSTVTFQAANTVNAKQIRIVNTVNGDFMNATEIEAFAALTVPGTDATLGDLRLDGKTIDGFSPDTTDYTVDLPYGVEANPKLQAFASDNAATVTVNAPETGLSGTSSITVTSADGKTSKTYTVTFNAAELAELTLRAPSKTEYRIGEKLDTGGLTVTAVYKSGTQTVHSENIALNDPQLTVSGFESGIAGEKTVTVSYRGVSAVFKVMVKADSPAPGPDAQQPEGNPGPGTGPGAGTGAGSGDGQPLTNTGAPVIGAALGGLLLLALGMTCLLATRRRGSASR
jgi:hypothetical protein